MFMHSLVLVWLLSYSQIAVTTACFNPSGKRKDFDGIDDFRKQILDAHNYYRCLHRVPPLTLNSKLNSYAQEVAEDNAKRGTLQHSSGSGYGENLYYSFGESMTGLIPTKAWYDEEDMYDYHYPRYSSSTGHFTQVVWKSTTELGCGYAKDSNQQDYITCNYDPHGNIANMYHQNVLPPLGK